MESLTKLIKAYEHLKMLYPEVYINIAEVRSGDLWRIKIFAHDLAIIGDAELLSVEHEDRDEAVNRAIAKMNAIPSYICELMEIKRLGRKIQVK